MKTYYENADIIIWFLPSGWPFAYRRQKDHRPIGDTITLPEAWLMETTFGRLDSCPEAQVMEIIFGRLDSCVS